MCQAGATPGGGGGWVYKSLSSETYRLCSLMIVITTESSKALVILTKVESFPRLSVGHV